MLRAPDRISRRRPAAPPHRPLASLAAAALLTSVAAIAQADPVIIPTSVADPLVGQGTGLCIAQAISQAPRTIDLISVQQNSAFNGEVNAFMEAHLALGVDNADHTTTVLRTLFDLSNNNLTGNKASLGDFTNSVATCKIGGCNFIINDDLTSFGLRARGYLNITPDLAGKPLHIGFYADDAVSLTFYGPNGSVYPVVTREVQVGLPTWRVTNTVNFGQAGLYPFEILHMEIAEHAALEMSYLLDPNNTFTDVEVGVSMDPNKLSSAGFTLFPPEMFSQTLSGEQSFADINACKQCPRQFANAPGNGSCDPGYYCNDAALCAPCNTAKVCGPTCSPCGGATPFCVNLNGGFQCSQCTDDSQCSDPDPLKKCTCDAKTAACVCETHECNDDSQCPKGKLCQDSVCTPCASDGACAGNSCNCCPTTADGKQLTCGVISGDDYASCVECASDADCDGGKKCDPVVARCIDHLYKNESPDCCGDTCLKCPKKGEVVDNVKVKNDWYCTPSHIGTECSQCRQDMDCGDGGYCRSGICEACVQDRRCGERCTSCGSDTPFCFSADPADASKAACVRCLASEDCGSGACDLTTHQCTNACSISCGPGTPYCFGEKCVECYADTQCPCGGTCNLESNTCSTSCNNNGDCPSTDHCKWADDGQTKVCTIGQQPDDQGCGSKLGQLCQGSSIGVGLPTDSPAPLAGIAVLSGVLIAARRRKRAARKVNEHRSAS